VREVIDWPVELMAAWLAFFKVKAGYEQGGG